MASLHEDFVEYHYGPQNPRVDAVAPIDPIPTHATSQVGYPTKSI